MKAFEKSLKSLKKDNFWMIVKKFWTCLEPCAAIYIYRNVFINADFFFFFLSLSSSKVSKAYGNWKKTSCD